MDNRFCESCKRDHGPLYVCDSYSVDLRKQIESKSRKWKENLSDPEWVQSKIDEGFPPEVIAINKMFAGF